MFLKQQQQVPADPQSCFKLYWVSLTLCSARQGICWGHHLQLSHLSESGSSYTSLSTYVGREVFGCANKKLFMSISSGTLCRVKGGWSLSHGTPRVHPAQVSLAQGRHTNLHTHSHLWAIKSFPLHLHDCQETKAPGGNPRKHGTNVQTVELRWCWLSSM